MLWQWPQGLQISEWTEGLRIPAMLWLWPQGLESERTEGLRVPCNALAMAAGFRI